MTCVHEWTPAIIVAAAFIDGNDHPSVPGKGLAKEVNGTATIFKEGSATFQHTCTLCGITEQWKV